MWQHERRTNAARGTSGSQPSVLLADHRIAEMYLTMAPQSARRTPLARSGHLKALVKSDAIDVGAGANDEEWTLHSQPCSML